MISLVDVLLAPIGFLVALGADARDWVIVFPFAIFAMLNLFSREREQRLDSLVELSEAYRGTAIVLGDVIEYDDAYTGEHTYGVVELATLRRLPARPRRHPVAPRRVRRAAARRRQDRRAEGDHQQARPA